MQEWMLSFVGQFGYFGIFLLIFIENVFPPIPSEAVLLFGGALTVTTAMHIPGTILAATGGSLVGAIVLYALGWVFQAERLKNCLPDDSEKSRGCVPNMWKRHSAGFPVIREKRF